MRINYTPSVNIIRDQNRDLSYIPTQNSYRVANMIWDAIDQGSRSFNLIGSYGTGKSSFLWAFEQSVKGNKHFFKLSSNENQKIEFINFIGEYKSLQQHFATYLELADDDPLLSQKILSEVYQRYHLLSKGPKTLFIVIDEFGKFLEFAAKNAPEKELYFIQQLAEFANNPEHRIILITSVHQNFDAYAHSLSHLQKQEWTKVKGRFRELAFNESVEQLLLLAAERTAQMDLAKPDEKVINKAIKLYTKSKAFPSTLDSSNTIGAKIYPIDLITANVLTLALQRYGQNERSLFSFLESTDYTGIHAYEKRTNPFYNLSNAYNYLIFNFYSFLTSQYNQDRSSWSGIKNALDKIENEFKGDVQDAQKIVKTIGLLHLFAQSGSTLDKDFLVKYADIILGIKNSETLIELLEQEKIILYRRHNKRYILLEGTDVDIYATLQAAGERVNEITDIATLVEKNYNLHPVFAKAAYYKTGTPRLFEFKISNQPIEKLTPKGEIDGFINLVFNDRLETNDVLKASALQNEAIIYGFYQNSKSIKELIFEIERTKKAIEEVSDRDKVARQEFDGILKHQQLLLNHYILNNLYTDSGDVKWVFNGQVIPISNKRSFNSILTKICEKIYDHTPSYKNELVNRHRLPPPIYAAKRNFLKALSAGWELEDIGFDKDKFPPEKTIFITLLKQNGLVSDPSQATREINIVEGSSFVHLWKVSNDFLESTRKNRKRVSELVDLLSKRPFKLKQGLIDFWLPSFLFIKKNDFAIFYKNAFLPNLNDEILELITKNPQDYELKAFDLEGIRLDIFNCYRAILSQTASKSPTNQTFIETIKPFLVFYTKLPEYSKNTKRLQKETFAIRQAIATSTDPEKTFFEEFPIALGYSVKQLHSSEEILETYTSKLQDAIREIRTCYDEMINRFEAFILSEVLYDNLDFQQYKLIFRNRFVNLRKHLLLPNQKVFIQRLYSELDDRRAWLSSIAQAILGKNLESLKDEDEVLLCDRFKSMIMDLDNLTTLSKTDVNEEKEEIYNLEISSFDSIEKKIVRLPKKKQAEIAAIESKIREHFGTDKTLNIAALMHLLQELLKKEN